jgi:replicative DNA helicase
MDKLPYSLEAEKSVIYSILMDNNRISEVFVDLSESDFHFKENIALIKAIKDLHNQGRTVELVTLEDYLDSYPDLKKEVPENYIMNLFDVLASPSNIQTYIDIVAKKSKLKKLIITMKSMVEEAQNMPQDTDEFMDKVQQKMFDLSMKRSKNEVVEIKDALKDFFSNLKIMQEQKSSLTGVTTGFKKLDDITAGLQPSDLIILAARPAMGKTSLALNILANAAKAGHKVAIFSLEMPVQQLVNRLVAAEASLNSSNLRKGKLNSDEWNKLQVGITNLIKKKIFFDDTGSITVSELASKARMLKMKEGLDLIVIDYIQLMKGTGESSRELEISTISRSLKVLAKELNVPMLVLSQLNRKVDSRPNKRPMISDLRESGAIEQDADQILFIYRGEVYKDKDMEEGVAEVIIAKNRHGSIGEFLLVFQSEFTKFENRMEDSYEDMNDGI